MDPKFPRNGVFKNVNNLFDSAQCQPILDLRSFQFLSRVGLSAVLTCKESDSMQC